jgi:acyl-CoA dehydrogenase
MPYTVTDEHKRVSEVIAQFLAKEYPEPQVRDDDNAGRPPTEAWDKMCKLGWMAWPIEEEYGGLGGDMLGTAIITESLALGSLALATLYVNSTYSASHSLTAFGSPEQKAKYLTKLAKGETRFAFGFTEPDSGQDVLGALKTHAKKTDSGYVLNGSKVFTTNATVSDYAIVLARTGTGERKHHGLSVFVVPIDAPGVKTVRMDEICQRSSPSCEIYFDDVELGEDALIGTEGNGWSQITKSLNVERILVAALALGNSQAALDHAVEYCNERQAFGGSIGRFQALQHPLADAAVKIDAARMLIYRAASLYDQGLPHRYECLAAKYAASEVGLEVTEHGMRILAGYGHVTEYPMQRYFRDARVFTAGPITSEMAKNQIAENHLGLDRSY